MSSEDFYSDSFDVQRYVESVGLGNPLSETFSKLLVQVELINQQINNQVVMHHEELLEHACGVNSLETSLVDLQERVDAIYASIIRSSKRVSDSTDRMHAKAKQLSKMQETCDLLRIIIRVSQLSRRLQSYLSVGDRDLAKAAQAYSELFTIFTTYDLTGIDAVADDRLREREAAQIIAARSTCILDQSLESLSQNSLGTALQVYFYLDELPSKCKNIITSLQKNVTEEISQRFSNEAFSKSDKSSNNVAPGRSNMILSSNSAVTRAHFWSAMDKLSSVIISSASKIHMLNVVLRKKKDSTTHKCFINVLDQDLVETTLSLNSFVSFIENTLKTSFIRISRSIPAVKQVVESDYPKLLKFLITLSEKFHHFLSFDSKLSSKTVVLAQLRRAFIDYENAYLSKSLSKSHDAVNNIFLPEKKSINKEEIDALIAGIENDLSTAIFDDHFLILTCKNVAKTIALFNIKAEGAIPSGEDTHQVISKMNTSQLFLMNIINVSFYFLQAFQKLSKKFQFKSSSEINKILSSTFKELSSFIKMAASDWMNNVFIYIKRIILTLHTENFSKSDYETDSLSLYIIELDDFTSRVYSDFIVHFECSSITDEVMSKIVDESTRFYLRHLSLIRPLSQPGIKLIQEDILKFEKCMLSLSPQANFSPHFRQLRCYKSILTLSPDEISSNETIGKVIPLSIVINYLFSCSSAELSMPYISTGMSIEQYSEWLDNHSEAEHNSFLKTGLESYVRKVRREGGKEYVATYPIILKLLQDV